MKNIPISVRIDICGCADVTVPHQLLGHVQRYPGPLEICAESMPQTIGRQIRCHHRAEEQIALLEDQLLQTEQFRGCNSDIDRAADAFANEKKLTYEMAHAFIEAIHVFSDGRREIVWKFKDIAELLGTT